jgi:hypothetical protein
VEDAVAHDELEFNTKKEDEDFANCLQHQAHEILEAGIVGLDEKDNATPLLKHYEEIIGREELKIFAHFFVKVNECGTKSHIVSDASTCFVDFDGIESGGVGDDADFHLEFTEKVAMSDQSVSIGIDTIMDMPRVGRASWEL